MPRSDAIPVSRDSPTADGLIVLDERLKVTKCNHQAMLLLHCEHGGLVGTDVLARLPAEVRASVQAGTRLTTEIQLHGTGLLFIFEPIPFAGVAGVILLRDVHQEGQMARDVTSLQEEVQSLRCVTDGPPAELWVTDNEGRTVHVSNPEELYGLPESALVGRKVSDLEGEGLFYPAISLLVLEEERSVTALQATRAGRRYLTTAHPVFDNNGDIQLVMTISRDITGLYHLKQQLADLEKLIQQYVITLESESGQHNIVVDSPAMQEVLDSLRRIAGFDSTVLFLGETGTGKDTLARLLHHLSRRNVGPFVKVNCGAIPETLMESEFFGYMPGAFTGAHRAGKKGLVEMANHGTLFLDEVNSLSLHLQAKLLHVIQEREFMPVGGTRPVQVDVRFVAATNQNLEELVMRGEFREDLYYRLNVVPIEIPPLRERREEIVPLATFFLHRLYDRYGVERQLDDLAAEVLTRYDWPGNVRQLENVMERCLVTGSGPVITAECLFDCLRRREGRSLSRLGVERGTSDGDQRLDEMVAEVERALLVEAMTKYGSTRKIAAHLGLSQSTVVRKMHRFGLIPQD